MRLSLTKSKDLCQSKDPRLRNSPGIVGDAGRIAPLRMTYKAYYLYTELTASYPFLSKIDTPEDLRKYPVSDLEAISADVREYLIDSIAQTGGHFGAGLGVVELTVALHYALNTPTDKLVWDVGPHAEPPKK